MLPLVGNNVYLVISSSDINWKAKNTYFKPKSVSNKRSKAPIAGEGRERQGYN